MKFDHILSEIGQLPVISNDDGKRLYDFILNSNTRSILEIGMFHGKSTLFMASALDEIGEGLIDAIDLVSAQFIKPNIVELAEHLGLQSYINPIFSNLGSQWELRKIISMSTLDGKCHPKYDLCFVDGYHSWERAGLDFFLCDKLLKPGGWIIFDDLCWSFANSPSWKDLPETKSMPDDYRSAHQVGEVFELLVRQHPSYEEIKIVGNWGWARKSLNALT